MAWSFRKRIKIAPGVHINLSKKGVSTSIGTKGASITTGPRGTYLNTSIPGTGFYRRQKIRRRNRNSSIVSTNTTSQFFSSSTNSTNNKTNMSNNSIKQKGLGCAKIFLWILLAFNILMFIVGIAILISDRETNSSMNWIMSLFFGGAAVGCIILLIRIKQNPTNVLAAARQNKRIEKLKELVIAERNPLKKEILKYQLEHLILEEASTRLNPVIEKYTKKVSKEPKPEWVSLLQQLNDELKTAKEDAKSYHSDVLERLSENEKSKYAVFCDAYKSFKNSKRAWIIISEQSNWEVKASAKKLIDRKLFRFSIGCYNQLNIPYEVPKIPVANNETYYFYPQFVIVSHIADDFDVFPVTEVNLKYGNVNFQEEGIAPSDAQKVGTTYKYVNKNGGPDKRYSNNPVIPIVKYGEITIEPFGRLFQVSNCTSAMALAESYLSLQTVFMNDHQDSFLMTKFDANNGNETTSPYGITKYYFDEIWFAIQRIRELVSRLSEDGEFLQLTDSIINGDITVSGKTITQPEDKLPFYLLGDILNCYNGLGQPIDLSKREGLGLLLFSLLNAEPDLNIKYEHLNLCYEKGKVASENMLQSINEAVKLNGGKFMLEICLKDYDKSLHNQYVVLLYRFASLVAKADKTVTETEAKWLNEIIALKESENEDAVINPTINENNTKKKATRTSHLSPTKELETLIGLSSVKAEINSLTNYIKVQNMRQEKGMKVTPMSYHCVFTGNPGTGKTTVARIVSQIYKVLGILKKGHLVETDRSGLVAEYVGQTAVKTNKIIDSALDGILFIDEAYSLVDGGSSDYGKEAIATLLKRMEDDRDRLVVILAGYTDDMKRFIDSNPGLQSRFNRYIEFPDYSADELFQIFQSSAKKYEYKLTEEAQLALREALDSVIAAKDKNFGNGRFIRNLFEKVVEHQANRLSSEADVTSETLALIEKEDIEKSL